MLRRFLILAALLLLPLCGVANELLEKGNALMDVDTIEAFEQAYVYYEKALQAEPESYEVHWRLARYHRFYGDKAVVYKLDGWKDLAVKHGRAGMLHGEKASEINPEGVEGYYFYALSAGTLSNGVGVLTLLHERLATKIRTSFEKSYEMDKRYDGGGPMIGLATYWNVLPGFMRDRDKAIAYIREANAELPGTPGPMYYLAEILLTTKSKENHEEAKQLLNQIIATPESAPHFSAYYVVKAKDLLPAS